MTSRTQRTAPELASVLRDLTEPLRGQLRSQEVSQAQTRGSAAMRPVQGVACAVGSGCTALHLIEGIANALGADVVEARHRWEDVDRIRRHTRVDRANGGPPEDLHSYPDLLHALRGLIGRYGLTQRQVVQRDQSHMLRRSTLSAVLRGKRSARRDVAVAIVRACGVSDTAEAAWEAAW